MAAYEKTWQFDINRAITATTTLDCMKYTLWYYKALLCGNIGGITKGLWTVVGSSDAVAGGMDGVDRWGNTYNASKIVRGTGASGRSWVVLQSPPMARGLSEYMLISFNSSYDYACNVFTTASLPTGGSATTSPTLVNAAYCPANGSVAIVPTGNPGNMHFHGMLATDGSFIILNSRDNTAKFCSGFIGVWLGNAKPGDLYPMFHSMGGDGALSQGYGAPVLANNAIDNAQVTWMLPPDNSPQTSWAWAAILPSITNIPTGSDPFDSSYADMPMLVGSAVVSIRGLRGRIQDIAYFPGGAATGTVDSTPGAPTYMIVGSFWFPTNAAPIL